MKPDYLTSKIFLDSGNPAETRAAFAKLGFLDGQTTNPTLVAKNPQIAEMKNSDALDEQIIWEKYREVALQIREIIPNGSISAEVYADATTSSDEMITKGRELASWFSGIFVKLPITENGLRAAEILGKEGINVNMTLCFSQEQAAAVHAATRESTAQVYVSPFIGRLDDIGIHGIDLIRNIVMMYRLWGSHVQVLGASIRSLDHLFSCMVSGADIVTMPIKIIDEWVDNYGLTKNPGQYPFSSPNLQPIAFMELPQQDWMLYDIHHKLTDQGIQKFSEDWKNLFLK